METIESSEQDYWHIGDRVVVGEGDDREAGKIWAFRDSEDGSEEAQVGFDQGVAVWVDVRDLVEV